MLETLMTSDLWALVVAIAPAVGSVLATVISAVLAIKKVATVISEFRNSNEVKGLVSELKTSHEENKQLKKLNEKLLVELTRIKPAGWCDDKEGVDSDKN